MSLGEHSLKRNNSKKKKRAWVVRQQVNKGTTEKGGGGLLWKNARTWWPFVFSHFQNIKDGNLSTITIFLEQRAQMKFNIVVLPFFSK